MKNNTVATSSDADSDKQIQTPAVSEQKVTAVACILGAVASLGGFIFGYSIGEISGYFSMADFGDRFGQRQADGSIDWSASRQGAMTGLLPIGALFGALVAGRMTDKLGRRLSISVTSFFTCLGTVIEISSSHSWAQYAVGRFVTGLSVGSLSVCVPLYQSESVPSTIRGVVVSSYQLMITLGIWAAEMVNWGTHRIGGSASWRIPTGLMFAWAFILGVAVLFLPESPRYAYAKGDTVKAREDIAALCGLPSDHHEIQQQIDDIEEKCAEERASAGMKFSEIFTGPRMMYRTILGVVLGCGQQLTGANFFFYFGTQIFQSMGISDGYTVQLIIGSVNVISTIAALFICARYGRRIILLVGAAWMCACFLIYAFIGQFKLDHENPLNTPQAGNTLITFSCLAIAAFAISWGPLVWAVNAEMYPTRYRSTCMSLATASNWLWNFMLSFFTRFIVDAIHYYYGLVFAGCTGALFFIVFFFVIESKDRSLEEIDRMYIDHVNPVTSASYRPDASNVRARQAHNADQEA